MAANKTIYADTDSVSNGENLQESIEGSSRNLEMYLTNSCRHCPDWTKLLNNPNIQTFTSEGSNLYGIAIQNNEVYMTSNATPHILVYNLQNLSTVSRQINVPGLTSARGLVYNESDSCLYACNQHPGHIYKISTIDDSVTSWATETDGPHGLSISKQNNLLVSYYNCGQIDEFSTSGKIIRSIKLSDGITGINHSIELETGEFIVCQRTPLSRLCLVDSSGNVIKSYGDERGSDVGQLNQPEHVELDQKGNVLVSDFGNWELCVLTSVFEYVADVDISDTEFTLPVSFCWDKENDRLLLATWSSCLYVITP